MNRMRLLATGIGLLLGLAGGLAYSWLINPLEYTDTAPASLRQDFKEDYISSIASAYSATGDLDRARARLAFVGLGAAPQELARLAQSRLASGRPEYEAQALAQLAAILGEGPAPTTINPGSSATPVISSTLTATLPPTTTPRPTPSPTPGAPFVLVDKVAICDPDLPAAQLQIRVLDAAGEGVPGVRIIVVWDSGQDAFFTGLKPELGLGYADFTMQAATVYSLQLQAGESPVSGLIAEDCSDPSGSFPGSWRLTFQQPTTP